jgi:hypothetical protein
MLVMHNEVDAFECKEILDSTRSESCWESCHSTINPALEHVQLNKWNQVRFEVEVHLEMLNIGKDIWEDGDSREKWQVKIRWKGAEGRIATPIQLFVQELV